LPSFAPSFIGDFFNPTSPFLACNLFDGDDCGYTMTQSSPSTDLSGIGSFYDLLSTLISLNNACATSRFNGFDATKMPTTLLPLQLKFLLSNPLPV